VIDEYTDQIERLQETIEQKVWNRQQPLGCWRFRELANRRLHYSSQRSARLIGLIGTKNL
jgi:hypothetical protein